MRTTGRSSVFAGDAAGPWPWYSLPSSRPVWRHGKRGRDPTRCSCWSEPRKSSRRAMSGVPKPCSIAVCGVRPVALDWVLRARIAESRKQFDDALRFLAHVANSDPYAAAAWLLAGQD